MTSGNLTSWRAMRFSCGAHGMEEIEDAIATEFALTIKLDGEEFATIVCSPSHLREMVYGFLASEGIIREAVQVDGITLDEERGYAYVKLAGKPSISRDKVAKRVIGSCCGKSREFYFQNDMLTARTIMSRETMEAEHCLTLMDSLQALSVDFHRSGGVHNAALADGGGLLTVMTDIGRHNALDKLYGYCMVNGIRAKGKAIVFSGRLSSEVVLKAAKMGCGILLSKSAPTDLALRLAEDLGITCAGFIRRGNMTVYTHSERIVMNRSLP